MAADRGREALNSARTQGMYVSIQPIFGAGQNEKPPRPIRPLSWQLHLIDALLGKEQEQKEEGNTLWRS